MTLRIMAEFVELYGNPLQVFLSHHPDDAPACAVFLTSFVLDGVEQLLYPGSSGVPLEVFSSGFHVAGKSPRFTLRNTHAGPVRIYIAAWFDGGAHFASLLETLEGAPR